MKHERTPTRGVLYHLSYWFNRLICRALYHVVSPSHSPLPSHGPVLLVSDHSSYCDPMVLAATAGRPIIFLTAREVYESVSLNWLCKRALYIPVTRGKQDVGAVRTMLRALGRGEVVALFPEGGIDKNREEEGHVGVGYLALKTGAPVVPASITWDKPRPLTLGRSLFTPSKAIVRYGEPIVFPPGTSYGRENISRVTLRIMQSIRELQNTKPPTS